MSYSGYFVIADITGYTAFMTGSELEHANDILKTLFKTLHDNIKPPLLISNYQGDAILMYAPEGRFIQGQTLLEMIETLYYAFRYQLEQVHFNTTCTCNACRNIPNLDLKVFIHYGEYVLQEMPGRQELSGPDVIVVHRMTKNRVKEQTKVKAYALFTEAALQKMDMLEFCQAEMIPHSESYDHVGEVSMFVYDLTPPYERQKTRQRVVVPPEDIWVNAEIDLPLPPVMVWDYLNEPERKRQWMHIDGLRITNRLKGRVDVGTINHCAHGSLEMPMYILDWRPFEYVTTDTRMPLQGILRDTILLTPIDGGTHVDLRSSQVRGANWVGRILWRLLMPLMRRTMLSLAEQQAATLRQMIEDELTARESVTAPSLHPEVEQEG
jgi:uncharacterized protein YndB with AHSA1/START domain